MKIACVSLDQAWEDRESNLEQCREHAARAASLGADLVVFPEMTLTGFTMNAAAIVEPHDASPSIGALSSLARGHGVSIAFGVVLEGAVRPRNSLVVVGRDGTELGRYAKIHPFTYASEDRSYESGEDVVAVRVDDVAIGLSICYDLRFPELYTALAAHSEVVLVIANWPARRIEHWTALLRARAIEGQCYAVGVNRTGTDGNGYEYPRSTRVFDPHGEVLAPVATSGVVDVFEIDAAAVAEYRAAFPVLKDRRPHIYRRIAGPEG